VSTIERKIIEKDEKNTEIKYETITKLKTFTRYLERDCRNDNKYVNILVWKFFFNVFDTTSNENKFWKQIYTTNHKKDMIGISIYSKDVSLSTINDITIIF